VAASIACPAVCPDQRPVEGWVAIGSRGGGARCETSSWLGDRGVGRRSACDVFLNGVWLNASHRAKTRRELPRCAPAASPPAVLSADQFAWQMHGLRPSDRRITLVAFRPVLGLSCPAPWADPRRPRPFDAGAMASCGEGRLCLKPSRARPSPALSLSRRNGRLLCHNHSPLTGGVGRAPMPVAGRMPGQRAGGFVIDPAHPGQRPQPEHTIQSTLGAPTFPVFHQIRDEPLGRQRRIASVAAVDGRSRQLLLYQYPHNPDRLCWTSLPKGRELKIECRALKLLWVASRLPAFRQG